jgi:hypothetical protein
VPLEHFAPGLGPVPCGPLSFEDEKLEALTVLQGIAQGTLTPHEAHEWLEKQDEVLVYFILKYIKKHYHKEHEEHDEVRARLVDLQTSYRAITRKAKAGEEDLVVEWFEGNHQYREMTAEEFIDVVVEKLEG